MANSVVFPFREGSQLLSQYFISPCTHEQSPPSPLIEAEWWTCFIYSAFSLSSMSALPLLPSRASSPCVFPRRWRICFGKQTVTSSSIHHPNECWRGRTVSPSASLSSSSKKKISYGWVSLSFPLTCSLCLSPLLLWRHLPEDHLGQNITTIFLHNCMCVLLSLNILTYILYENVCMPLSSLKCHVNFCVCIYWSFRSFCFHGKQLHMAFPILLAYNLLLLLTSMHFGYTHNRFSLRVHVFICGLLIWAKGQCNLCAFFTCISPTITQWNLALSCAAHSYMGLLSRTRLQQRTVYVRCAVCKRAASVSTHDLWRRRGRY